MCVRAVSRFPWNACLWQIPARTLQVTNVSLSLYVSLTHSLPAHPPARPTISFSLFLSRSASSSLSLSHTHTLSLTHTHQAREKIDKRRVEAEWHTLDNLRALERTLNSKQALSLSPSLSHTLDNLRALEHTLNSKQALSLSPSLSHTLVNLRAWECTLNSKQARAKSMWLYSRLLLCFS